MPDLLTATTPKDVISLAERGFTRFRTNRLTALATIRNASGQYYSRAEGEVMQNSLALSYNATRVLVPNLVFSYPKHIIETPFLAARQFAQDLGLALSLQDKQLRIDEIYRRVIIDALHYIGILKTGLAAGGDLVAVESSEEGDIKIDAGQIYTERVSPFQFFADPNSREYLFSDARFLGDILRVPKQVLLDTDGYDHDLVNELRPVSHAPNKAGAEILSVDRADEAESDVLLDMVEIAEVYVPSANAIVTIPGDFKRQDKFLRVSDYYGVKDQWGPYTFLSLTNPVPDNPLPTPFMSVLLDLETKVNWMEDKISAQASRQKDILVFSPDAADEASLIRDASDGDIVASSDPNNLQVKSFGGQQKSNEENLQMLLSQFNLLAANVETLAGVNSAAKSATAANLLQQNAGIVLADMQNAVYRMSSDEARKRSFYIFNDPLLNITVARRQVNSGRFTNTPSGPQWVEPPTSQEIESTLTPESKKGDFLDLTFTVEPESMGRTDSKTRLQNSMMFAQQIVPATASAAQLFQGLGIPFDAVAFMMRMAQELGIQWLDEVVYAPEVQQRAAMQYQKIMQATGQNVPASEQTPPPNPGLQGAMLQNGQPGNVQAPPAGPAMQQRQGAQGGAPQSELALRLAQRRAFTPARPENVLPNQMAQQ